jgi:hypothetical protein
MWRPRRRGRPRREQPPLRWRRAGDGRDGGDRGSATLEEGVGRLATAGEVGRRRQAAEKKPPSGSREWRVPWREIG